MSLNLNETDFLEKYPFLKVLDRPLDSRQLKVCCTDGDDAAHDNIVVAAGAGSGKTQVLAARFAFLVVTGAATVDQILTLTFTKKAAAEMYQRIYATLQKIALSEEAHLTAEQRERVECALRDFSSAHIQTLDSYCAYLVKQAANRYSIRPDFSSGGSDSSIKLRALEYVLTNQRSRGIAALAKAGAMQQVAEQFFAPVISRYTSIISPDDFFSSRLETQCAIISEGWNEAIEEFENLKSESEIVMPLLESILSAGGTTTGPKKVYDAASFLSDFQAELPRLSAEDIINHTKDEKISEAMTALKSVWEKVNTAIKGFKMGGALKEDSTVASFIEEVKRWKEKFVYTAFYSFISHIEDTKDLFSHLDAFMRECNQLKKQNGSLSFNDVSELALAILKDHADIRLQEHETYRRVMIDEFQDNNRKNGELLALIGRPVFFVGDDKQSIYKFRGAEVDVFNARQEEMKAGSGCVLPMDYNYRSNQEILDACNLIFGGYKVRSREALKNPAASKEEKFEKISPALSDPVLKPWVFDENFSLDASGAVQDIFKARFTIASTAEKNPSVAARSQNLFSSNNPLNAAVPVHAVMYNTKIVDNDEKDEYLDSNKRLGLYIARTIQLLKEKTEQEIDGETGKKRHFSYSDVAILDRSRTNRSSLTLALSRLGIPYSVDQQKDLFSEAIINDFYHFLRLCVYSFDVNAFAAFLRSPFASLSEQALESVLFVAVNKHPKGAAGSGEPVFEAFRPSDEKAILESLSEEDGKKYLAASALYREYQPLVLSSKLTATINRLWYDLGYWYNATWHADTAVLASQYDLLFALACQSDEEGHTAAWFVDQLAALKNPSAFDSDEGEMDVKEVSFPLEESDAVKIMTIHKSKGLQFKYVFVIGCTSRPKAESNSDQFFFTDEAGLSVKFSDDSENYFFTRQKEIADAKNDAEFRRLFYVALTRAEQQAWIVGSWSRPRSSGSKTLPPMVENIIEYYYSVQEKSLEEIEESGLDEEAYPYESEKCAPFDFTALYPVLKRQLYEKGEDSPSKESMRKRIETLSPVFEKAPVLTIPRLAPNRTSPSRLESSDSDEKSFGGSSAVPYAQVNAVIEKTFNADSGMYDFGYNDFGTLAHLFMEMNAKGLDTESWEPDERATKKLYGENRTVILEACRSMVSAFNLSERGKDFAQCKKRADFFRSEYEFRMKLAGFFVTGSIDLIYKSESGYVIVDYKTDQDCNPSRYYEQLYCYRKAAACLLRVDESLISCRLFYLRSGKEVDITGEVSSITEEDIAARLREGSQVQYDEGIQTSAL